MSSADVHAFLFLALVVAAAILTGVALHFTHDKEG